MWHIPQIASLFKVAGEEITGTQGKAHYSGTSGVSPTPRASSDAETAHHHRERRADCSHTRRFVFSQLCRWMTDRCKIALWRFSQALRQNPSQLVCAFGWISDKVLDTSECSFKYLVSLFCSRGLWGA